MRWNRREQSVHHGAGEIYRRARPRRPHRARQGARRRAGGDRQPAGALRLWICWAAPIFRSSLRRSAVALAIHRQSCAGGRSQRQVRRARISIIGRTRQGVRAASGSRFCARHSTGFYADLARAQVAKLNAAEPPKPPGRRPRTLPQSQPERVAGAGNAGESERSGAAGRGDPASNLQQPAPAPPRVQISPTQPLACSRPLPSPARRAATPAPPIQSASSAPSQNCKADEMRLARLRADPDVGQLRQFTRELACDDLRPQVQRLMESLGADPVVVAARPPSAAPAAPVVAAAPPAPSPVKVAALGRQIRRARRDEARLAQLRVDPVARARSRQFAHELSLRRSASLQVQRLMESLGARTADRRGDSIAGEAPKGIWPPSPDEHQQRRVWTPRRPARTTPPNSIAFAPIRRAKRRCASSPGCSATTCANRAARLVESLGD